MLPEKAAQPPHQLFIRYWRGSWQMALGVLLSGLCLWLVLRGVNLREMGTALASANILLVPLAILSVLATNVVKAVRWRILFPTESKPEFRQLLSAIFIGQFLNLVLPARVGEIGRAYLLKQDQRTASLAFGTIVTEKWGDILALLLGWLISLPFVVVIGWYVAAGQTLILMGLAATILVIGLAWRPDIALRLAQRIGSRLPIPAHWMEMGTRALRDILTGLVSLRKPQVVLQLLLWTTLVWWLASLTNWLALHALDLPASWSLALFTVVVLQSGIAVPSSPARVGVFHYLTLLSLAAFGLTGEVAVAYAFLLHLVVLGTVTAAGVVSLMWESWRRRATHSV